MDAAAENHHLHMSNGNRNTQLNTTGYPYRSDNLHMGLFDALSSLYIWNNTIQKSSIFFSQHEVW